MNLGRLGKWLLNLTPDDVLRVCRENWFGTNDIVYRSDRNHRQESIEDRHRKECVRDRAECTHSRDYLSSGGPNTGHFRNLNTEAASDGIHLCDEVVLPGCRSQTPGQM